MVSRAEPAGEVVSDRFYGGLVFRKGAGMHVGRFVRGLAKAAARRGVEMHERTPMTACVAPPAAATTSTHRRAGFTRSRWCWLAAPCTPGRWAGSGAGSFRSARFSSSPSRCPKRRSTGCCRGAGWRSIPRTWSTISGPRRTTGCSSAEARASPSRIRTPTRRAARSCRRALHDVFPELRQARIDYCWGGMVEMTRDRLPALQQSLSVGAGRWTHADRLSSRLPTQPESGSRRAFSGSPPRAGGAHQ